MEIVICGMSGFVGSALEKFYTQRGDIVRGISIRDTATPQSVATQIEGADVIINLAGANILGRWNDAYKKLLRDSRIHATQTITDALALAARPAGAARATARSPASTGRWWCRLQADHRSSTPKTTGIHRS